MANTLKFINMVQLTVENSIQVLNISCNAFNDNGLIPKKYTCDGININPSFKISFIPQNAVSISIIMEDPDAPINTWIHWVAWNIPIMHLIPENMKLGINGLNDFSKHFYCGPCPLNGTHRYVFKFFALDTILNLHPNTRSFQLEKAMASHVLAYGELSGYYKR